MPLHHEEDREYSTRSKKVFTKMDVIESIKVNDFNTRYIFANHSLELGFGDEARSKLKNILDQFYEVK